MKGLLVNWLILIDIWIWMNYTSSEPIKNEDNIRWKLAKLLFKGHHLIIRMYRIEFSKHSLKTLPCTASISTWFDSIPGPSAISKRFIHLTTVITDINQTKLMLFWGQNNSENICSFHETKLSWCAITRFITFLFLQNWNCHLFACFVSFNCAILFPFHKQRHTSFDWCCLDVMYLLFQLFTLSFTNCLFSFIASEILLLLWIADFSLFLQFYFLLHKAKWQNAVRSFSILLQGDYFTFL